MSKGGPLYTFNDLSGGLILSRTQYSTVHTVHCACHHFVTFNCRYVCMLVYYDINYVTSEVCFPCVPTTLTASPVRTYWKIFI